MSLSKKSAVAVDAAVHQEMPWNFVIEDGDFRLSVALRSVDTIGLAFDSLELAHGGVAGASTEVLRGWGDRLSRRATYLLEPLVVLEVDTMGGEVEIRSQTPSIRDGVRSYYQARIRQNGVLSLSRVSYDPVAGVRRPAVCQVTREVFERLIDDLVATAA